MRRFWVFVALLIALGVSACNPFYSVEQSAVERGYRWIWRGKYDLAISSFHGTLINYPSSSLAHVGMADALMESRRELEAVDMYAKALSLLKSQGQYTLAAGEPQTLGERAFSYQNQGLSFPYGIGPYVYLRRGIAYERLAGNSVNCTREHWAAALADYNSAIDLAPDWDAPRERLASMNGGQRLECKN